jgi:TetR/AcrR family transcriptional repressor of uid operon
MQRTATAKPRKTTRKAEERKDQIIETARKSFIEHGLHRTRTAHIREAAGISSGNLFYHFKNKQEILEAVVKDSVERATRHIAEFLASHPDPIRALTEFTALAKIMRAGWGMPPGLRLEIYAESERNENLRKLLYEQSSVLLELIEQTLASAEAHDLLPPHLNRAEFARVIHLIWNGISMSRSVGPKFDVKDYQDLLTDFVEFWLRAGRKTPLPERFVARGARFP